MDKLKVFNKTSEISFFGVFMHGFIATIIFILGFLLYKNEENDLIIDEISFKTLLIFIQYSVVLIIFILCYRLILDLVDVLIQTPFRKFIKEDNSINFNDSGKNIISFNFEDVKKINYKITKDGLIFKIYLTKSSPDTMEFHLADNYLIRNVTPKIYEKKNLLLLRSFFENHNIRRVKSFK
jgi:hypothetical protein